LSLNLLIVSQYGIWISSDHRLVEVSRGRGRAIDNWSVKHIGFKSSSDGGAAVIAYAGVGRLSDVDISDWMREFMRGPQRTMDQHLVYLRERATIDLGPHVFKHQIRHMFSVGAVVAGKPRLVQIRNFETGALGRVGPATSSFGIAAREATGGVCTGFPDHVSEMDRALLTTVANRKPRDPEQFSALLAAINARVASSNRARLYVSSHCLTTYLSVQEKPTLRTRSYGSVPGDDRRVTMPFMMWGIDFTETERWMTEGMRRFSKWHRGGRVGPRPDDLPTPADKLAWTPRNRLASANPGTTSSGMAASATLIGIIGEQRE
jgi:hypothetical protein